MRINCNIMEIFCFVYFVYILTTLRQEKDMLLSLFVYLLLHIIVTWIFGENNCQTVALFIFMKSVIFYLL